MSSHFTPFTLKDISRPGGGFAMLAVDQRAALMSRLRVHARFSCAWVMSWSRLVAQEWGSA